MINEIEELCNKEIEGCNTCNGDPDYDCVDCTQGGKAILAHKIIEIIEGNKCECITSM